MESLDPNEDWADGPQSAERTRALLMVQRARVPLYFAMAQVAIVSIAVPWVLDLRLLAVLGVAVFAALWATLRAVDRSLEAFRGCSHLVYLVSLVALAYAVLGLRLSGNLTVYSTAAIVLGSAYLLGTRAALFWAAPCLVLAGVDSFMIDGPAHPVPPVVTFVVRTTTISTILAFAISFRWAHDQQAAQLENEARTDALTGLSNRLAFEQAFDEALDRARRFNRRGAVLFADFDGMKAINDRFGHATGDDFLREIASRIRGLTRRVDTPARLGGDEFVILVGEFTDPKGPEILARRLSASISVPWLVEDHEIIPSVSIGIAEFGESDDPARVLQLADEAMYTAKRSSTTRICAAHASGIREIV